MFGVRIQFDDQSARAAAELARRSMRALARAGFAIRREIIALIERSPNPSEPGEPVHTRAGLARRAMRYAVDRDSQSVVVGPLYSVIGRSMEPHEHGGTYKGVGYPARPTAAAGLKAAQPRIGPMFRDM